MKSSTRLDSAVFQLTPTRTRCDMVIYANGKTDKIASGLLNPFIAHLKTAQEQVDKGGYSIILQPESGKDALWFTKGTVERFVRFVSTPEILERVYTLESEILQIEEAISIQGFNEMALTVEENQGKPSDSIEGSRPLSNGNDEKAIVLYEPGGQLHEANGSTAPERNSKIQLLKVLETRKTMLQKEQGMAFARAEAAGFNIDSMYALLSFSECFGASRLKDACTRFKELWKKKHEMGQWLEIEAAETMSSRSEFSAMNASGIMLSSVANKHKELKETWPELASETSGKPIGTTSSDEKPSMDGLPQHGHQEYFQGQFPYQYPPWPIHSSPGALPVFQGYPMQGMPYYQNYPGAGPYYQPPYPMAEDPRLNPGQKIQKRHSMDSSNNNLEAEACDMDDADLEKEDSHIRESRKRTSRLANKQSGMVVIRNINYITSKEHNSSDTESQSDSDSQTEEEDGSGSSEKKHKKLQRSSKRQGDHTNKQNEPDKAGFEEEADGGHWLAFQNLLLKDADDDRHVVDQGMLAMETKAQLRKWKNTAGDDAIVSGDQDRIVMQNGSIGDMHKMSGIFTHMPKNSTDECFISERENHLINGRSTLDNQMHGRRVGYMRSTDDDVMIHRSENQSAFTSSPSDPLVVNGFDRTTNDVSRKLSHNMDDDSYIVSLRSSQLDQIQSDNKNAIDMDSEFPAATQKPDNMSTRAGNLVNYEPDDLSLMPHRGVENEASGYDPAFDYELQVQTEDGVPLNKKNKEVVTDSNKGAKKLDKDQKSKMVPDASDKKKLVGPIRRGKPSKLSPLDEAKARAEKLRSFKADLQKMKKEKEGEEMKRLESLKLARQKRIAAKSGNVPAQSALSSQQSRKQIPAKTSPGSHKGSKFSDSEPGPSSSLQRFPIKNSPGSTSSEKTSKVSRLNTGSHSPGNRLIRSASSLPEQKKNISGVTTHTITSMSRIRRLSEPKMSSSVSAVKLRSNETISKSKVSDGPPSKNISAIVNHDKTKAATLPELKTRTSKGPDVTSKSAAKEMTQKGDQNRPAATSGGVEPKSTSDNVSHHNEGDDNMIVDKSVVILEREKPLAPVISVSENNARIKNECDNVQIREKPEVESDYSAVHPSASSYELGAVDSEPTGHQSHEQIDAQRVYVGDAEKVSPKFSNVTITEKPYQAPYARVSSFEDPCTGNSEYCKAPSTNLESAATSTMAVKAHVSNYRDLKLEKIPEATEKSQVKDSSKGFKRLLKFGRKSNSSTGSERNADSDNVSTNGSEADDGKNAAGQSEVHTLKNLISQDETLSVTTTPQKSSRHFSLLSPFRSKISDKKPTA